MLLSVLKIADRQGLLKGDLNWIQRSGLSYLMNKETDELVAVERARMENTALATNQHTSQAFLEEMFKSRSTQDELEVELEEQGYEVDWHTPSDASEVEDVLRNLGLSVPMPTSKDQTQSESRPSMPQPRAERSWDAEHPHELA